MAGAAEATRARFAEEMRASLDLKSQALVAAFAGVPRERFVGPGPWWVSQGDGFVLTPDADPRHLYADVRVVLDRERELNNGKPYNHARWMDALAPEPGEHVAHVGAGTGYYSAILAELVGSSGRVTAIEVDPLMFPQLERNVAHLPQVRALHASALDVDFGAVDGLYANAGLTSPPAPWLDRLRPGGRMILPLSEMLSERALQRSGATLWVRRAEGAYEARFLSAQSDLRIYPCQDGRDAEAERRLARAFKRGGYTEVRSLRRDEHAPGALCWLHGPDFCLSRVRPG